jgi:ubiquitin C-terminal hydrolase
MWGGSHSLEYRLVSVAHHLSGSEAQGGHYYSYILNKHEWYLCNDENVSKISNIQDLSSRNAYYMIYERMA